MYPQICPVCSTLVQEGNPLAHPVWHAPMWTVPAALDALLRAVWHSQCKHAENTPAVSCNSTPMASVMTSGLCLEPISHFESQHNIACGEADLQ